MMIMLTLDTISVKKNPTHTSLSQDIIKMCEPNLILYHDLSQPYGIFALKVTYINGKLNSHTLTQQSFITPCGSKVKFILKEPRTLLLTMATCNGCPSVQKCANFSDVTGNGL